MQDLGLPVVIALLLGAVVAGAVWRLVVRDRLAGVVAGTLATLVMAQGFDARLSGLSPILQALTPISLGGIQNTVYSVVIAVAVLWLAALAGRGVSRLVDRLGWKSRDIATAVAVAIVGMAAVQFWTLIMVLGQEWPQFFYHAPKLAAAPAAAKASSAKPDIYYLVLEDYASQDVLKNQFSFDNNDFMSFLKSKGYYVNPTQRVNYPYTAMSVASTLSANYLNDIVQKFSKAPKQTVVPFNDATRDAPVAQALKSAGYKYIEIGNWYEAFDSSRSDDQIYQPNGLLTVFGHTFVLNNFPKYKLTESLFGSLLEMGIHLGKFTVLGYQNLGDVDLAHYQLSTLKNLVSQPSGGRFIMADILVPHEAPFYFNADGSISQTPDGNNNGEPLRKKYVGAVKYINAQVKTILQQIDDQSHGRAVIVLMSDEGPQILNVNDESYDQGDSGDELLGGDMRKWSQENLDLKYGVLAAFSLPGVDQSAVSANNTSDVNIFRLVLNSYLGYSLPYLPNCNFAYPDGRNFPERFVDITARVSGTSDARCQANGTVKP
ncbi:MAG TPA: sulfatase-like hydrolase/transferase [Candidatus Saccharimonadia bacterium]|jgi:hypothetical protein